jgi:LuxR family maltose regulon positive regulatory protein
VARPILETKLFVPRRRRGLVVRPRLRERLGRSGDVTLTLVSAPAGFGKTTAVADWLADVTADGRPVAWVSLDAADSQPTAFWTAVLTAIDRAAPGTGTDALQQLETGGSAVEPVIGALLDALVTVAGEVTVVVDDYHVIADPTVHAGMAYFLEHLPETVHLVVITRADPPFPLARLRAGGRLVEIRAADLRFTNDEAAAYLHDSMGLDVAPADVAALEARTEGWIAALQLAALSLQGRDDVHDFITNFAGDDRYVVDYLVEEVLRRQPDDVRAFLMTTSILARMTGAAVDALTGRTDGRAMLEALDRANLFVVPLDDRRRWYRYHHLFADVLRAHLEDEDPARVRDLHQRASAWYEAEGDHVAAIDHALDGGAPVQAAELIERSLPALRRARLETTMRGWFERLPRELLDERPVLSMGHVGALMASGTFEGVEAPLRAAERRLDGPDRGVVIDEIEFRRLPSQIAMYRAALARIAGDAEATKMHARRVFELASADDDLGRGGAAALIGLACWSLGELSEAERWYTEAMARLERADHLSDVLGCALAASDIVLAQGRLTDAARILERGLTMATSAPGAPLRGTADMHVALAEIDRERGDLTSARDRLSSAAALGDANGLPQNPYRSRVAAALVARSDGDLDRSVELLTNAEQVYDGDFSPDVRPIGALRARTWIAQGRDADARRWARDRGLAAEDELTYLSEFEHLTLALVLVAQASAANDRDGLADALRFSERLRAAARAGGRTRSIIETLVIDALARDALGERGAALDAIRGALALAEPEGYARVVLDAGPAVGPLLARIATGGDWARHAERLLAASRGGAVAPVRARGPVALVEPLSDRELEVLHLLQGELDGPDIARELSVSLNTLRTHTKNIYAKLGVTSRRAAVRRAVELDLLSR